MTPEELARRIEGLIISGNDEFASEMVKIQNRLYNRLVLTLKNIEVDSSGYILQSSANRKVLNQAVTNINEAFAESSGYSAAIEKHLEIIPSIDKLNNVYFESISSGFTPNKNFIKSLQKQTITSLENSLLNEGLQSQVKGPLVDILNRNINSGGSFNGFLQEVRDYVKGSEKVDGRLLSYTKGITKDALSIYARTYQQSITSDLGLKWYLYAGGIMDKSREFCIERAGNYYHEDEIKQWPKLDWQGKMKGTTESSIFYYVAGHNCIHQLIAVHDSIVPKDDLDRVK
jgi:hypothetical protein